MNPGYHHLYEWGNCPIFLMVGQVNDVACKTSSGGVQWRPKMSVRVSFDERINDGLSAFRGIQTIKRVLENPFEELGCLDDSVVDRPLICRPEIGLQT